MRMYNSGAYRTTQRPMVEWSTLKPRSIINSSRSRNVRQ
jgi:hypothetical protein